MAIKEFNLCEKSLEVGGKRSKQEGVLEEVQSKGTKGETWAALM